jgi:cellulose synthase/poly-beta-1,6-N-acetylglucosamine synthase-like glycosyltransferase
MMDNLLQNFQCQDWKNKELIIVLNRDDMNLSHWRKKAEISQDIRISQLPEAISLGHCLNYAVNQTRGEFIAFFDDDDYYAPGYISSMMPAFEKTGADIIGKRTHFVYLERNRNLYLRFPGEENTCVTWVCGGKKIVRRYVFDHVSHRDESKSEDVHFCMDCRKRGFRIYSVDRFNFVYIRYSDSYYHTWKINDEKLVQSCKFIALTDDYKSFCVKKKGKGISE